MQRLPVFNRREKDKKHNVSLGTFHFKAFKTSTQLLPFQGYLEQGILIIAAGFLIKETSLIKLQYGPVMMSMGITVKF